MARWFCTIYIRVSASMFIFRFFCPLCAGAARVSCAVLSGYRVMIYGHKNELLQKYAQHRRTSIQMEIECTARTLEFRSILRTTVIDRFTQLVQHINVYHHSALIARAVFLPID